MSKALEILMDQAKKKAEELALQLAKSRDQLGKARDKLQMLEQYQIECETNAHQKTVSTAFTISQLRGQNAFVSKVGQAIAQQRTQVEFYQKGETWQLKKWQEALMEQKKYEALLSRQAKKLEAIQNKRDQKMNDEFAARIHRVRTQGESA